jgi:phage-related minor tail protein
MGGRHKPGSRAGAWKKTEQKLLSKFKETLIAESRQELTEEIKAELQRTSTLEKEAAMTVAAQWKQQADALEAEAEALRQQLARLTGQRQKILVRRIWIHGRRRKAAPTSTSHNLNGSKPVDRRDEIIETLVLQVNALKEENVLFNQLRFRCRKCN